MEGGDINEGIWAALLLKPSWAAKTRLSHLRPSARAVLALAMAADVIEAICRSAVFQRVIVVSADPAHAILAAGRGAELVWEPAPAGLDEAAARAVEASGRGGGSGCALFPGDIPLADATAIARATRSLATVLSAGGDGLGLVPCRRGEGTNMMLCSTAAPPRFAFGAGSFARHAASVRRARVHEDRDIALDIDTPGDLDELTRRLAACGDAARRTAAALAQGCGEGARP